MFQKVLLGAVVMMSSTWAVAIDIKDIATGSTYALTKNVKAQVLCFESQVAQIVSRRQVDIAKDSKVVARSADQTEYGTGLGARRFAIVRFDIDKEATDGTPNCFLEMRHGSWRTNYSDRLEVPELRVTN